MVEEATDRESLASGVEIYVNIARMLFETLEGQVFKVRLLELSNIKFEFYVAWQHF